MGQINALYKLFGKYPRICTDSRLVTKDSIFFALKGENFDGNNYAATALQAGASIAVIDDPTKVESDQYFLVEDTLRTLQKLAAHHREHLKTTSVLAITGSNGKTTTKELARRILAKKYRTVVTEGNLNNHIGVPLTILRMNHETEIGIVEMGANHRGEITLLCDIAQPDYGLITNIGYAHLEGFGSEEGVKKGKGELFDYLLENGGTAIYSPDDPILSELIASHRGLKSIPYSTGSLAPATTGGYIIVKAHNVMIKTQLVGDYNLLNVAAAIAIGKVFNIEMDDIVPAIESYVPENNRSQRAVTEHNELILDFYNANPSSMIAALNNFFKQKDSLPKAVILGDMLELGIYSDAEHKIILERIETSGIREAFLVGKHFMTLFPAFEPILKGNTHFHTFSDVEHLIGYLEKFPLQGYHILIKGSRGIHLEKVVSLL